ncbi:hypothetical protein G6F37_013233 [Rhizopus arrhizus]|nr:hypothetical protein G6F37_013233 [Rhizopus arrhizus]
MTFKLSSGLSFAAPKVAFLRLYNGVNVVDCMDPAARTLPTMILGSDDSTTAFDRHSIEHSLENVCCLPTRQPNTTNIIDDTGCIVNEYNEMVVIRYLEEERTHEYSCG